MNIRVKSLQGEEYVVDVSNDQLVSQLKATISERASELPIERQKLVYKGRTMQDTNLLGDYNLEDGCKVHLIMQKEGITNLQSSPSSSSAKNCPTSISSSTNQQPQKIDPHLQSRAGPTPSMTAPATTDHPDSASGRPLSRFEIILKERLGQHFSAPAIEKIMTHLQHEIDADINLSSLDDLERLAKQKLNITNE